MSEAITIDDLPRFMEELRGMARGLLQLEYDAHSIRPTALVHSALCRNKGDREWDDLTWRNRAYFFGAMKRAMRRALVDHARKKRRLKRPPLTFCEPEHIDFGNLVETLHGHPDRIIALEEAVAWLEQVRPDLAEIVGDRYYLLLSLPEIARLHDQTEAEIRKRWRQARVLLCRRIEQLMESPALDV